jgi:hypothetical protein
LPREKIFAEDLSAGASAPLQRRENARITSTDSRRICANGTLGGRASMRRRVDAHKIFV